MDLAHFFNLKETLKSKKLKDKEPNYYIILPTEDEIIEDLKVFAESKSIHIVSLSEFEIEMKSVD